jgi:xylulokinase
VAAIALTGQMHGAVMLDEACAQAIHVAQRIEPDLRDVATYRAGYAKWGKLYPALKSLRD